MKPKSSAYFRQIAQENPFVYSYLIRNSYRLILSNFQQKIKPHQCYFTFIILAYKKDILLLNFLPNSK